MPDMMVTSGNLYDAMSLIQDEIARSHVAMVSVSSGATGKWSMARLWRAWMATTAQWMAANGATMPLGPLESKRQYGSRPFNQDDAHELSWSVQDAMNIFAAMSAISTLNKLTLVRISCYTDANQLIVERCDGHKNVK